MRRMGRANGGKALDVSLLLRSGGEGLQVIAHVSRLPDAQRARIREEVVRMLASHGFAPHHVILNGEAHPFALSHNEALECR